MIILEEVKRSGLVRFTVAGRPESQPCPGFNKGKCHNKKAALLKQRRSEIQEGMRAEFPAQNGPMFDTDWLVVESLFYFKRPRDQMRTKGGLKHLPSCIRNSFPLAFVRRCVDVDNLAKFVLDLMKGPIHTDDHQVVGLKVTKVHDNDGECKGKTKLKVTKITALNQLAVQMD